MYSTSGGRIGFLDIRTPSTLKTHQPTLQILLYSDEISIMNQQNFIIKEKKGIPATTILKRWLPFCLAIDFQKQRAQVSYAGSLSESKAPRKSSYYQDKFGGDDSLRDMNNSGNNFTVRIGRYHYDSLSMVGRVVAINAWNRRLTGGELADLTNCKDLLIKNGNIINQDTVWHQTAPLVEQYQVDSEELMCSQSQQVVTAFIPVNSLDYEDAVDMCHKFGADVDIAGEFNDEEAFKRFYENLWSDQAENFRKEDDLINRGRLRMWLPYKVVNITGLNKVVHTSSGSELGVDAWIKEEEKLKVLNASSVNLCLSSFMGIKPYKQNLKLTDCHHNTHSVGCSLKNSFTSTTSLVLRGLCKLSALDTLYKVHYTR